MKLNEVLRSSHTKRWGIVNVVREQSVAEHSFNVAQITGHLAVAVSWPGLFHTEQALKLMQWALNHDAVEVFTGDIPTPFKTTLKHLGFDLAAAERVEDEGYGSLAASVRGTVVEDIVKLADIAESVHFLRDHGVGPHAAEVHRLLRQQMWDLVRTVAVRRPELDIHTGFSKIAQELDL